MRAFLDTNVLIDLLTERPPEGAEAVKLLAMQELGDVELWASAKSFTDMFYVMREENPSEVVQQAFIDSLEYLQVCELGCEDIRAAAERIPVFQIGMNDIYLRIIFILKNQLKLTLMVRKIVLSLIAVLVLGLYAFAQNKQVYSCSYRRRYRSGRWRSLHPCF